MANLSQKEKLKLQLCDLAELMIELIGICYDAKKTQIAPELVSWVKENYVDTYNIDEMMKNFVKYTRLHWDRILNRDEDYFITDAIKIFGDIDPEQVNITKVLFSKDERTKKSIISTEDKDAIWDMVTVMVKISIVHIHKCRDPFRDSDGVIKYKTKAYTEGDYKVDNLHYFAEKFGIDLNKHLTT